MWGALTGFVLLACMATAFAVPVLVIAGSIFNIWRAKRGRISIFLTAVVSLIAWIAASYAAFFVYFVGGFLGGLDKMPRDQASAGIGTAILLVAGVGYLFLGSFLSRLAPNLQIGDESNVSQPAAGTKERLVQNSGPSGACPYCGNAVSLSLGECPQCGRELQAGLCPNCEQEIPLSSLECPKCTARFGPRSAWQVRPLTRT